jgi:hypothetical protein
MIRHFSITSPLANLPLLSGTIGYFSHFSDLQSYFWRGCPIPSCSSHEVSTTKNPGKCHDVEEPNVMSLVPSVLSVSEPPSVLFCWFQSCAYRPFKPSNTSWLARSTTRPSSSTTIWHKCQRHLFRHIEMKKSPALLKITDWHIHCCHQWLSGLWEWFGWHCCSNLLCCPLKNNRHTASWNNDISCGRWPDSKPTFWDSIAQQRTEIEGSLHIESIHMNKSHSSISTLRQRILTMNRFFHARYLLSNGWKIYLITLHRCC